MHLPEGSPILCFFPWDLSLLKKTAFIPFVTAGTATLRLTRLINVYNARVDAHAAFCFVQIIFHCFAVRPKCVENPTGNEAISMS